jgi:hypothetical protein
MGRSAQTMIESQLVVPLSASTPSLQWQEPTVGSGRAPHGTLFALSADGGCAAVPQDGNEVTLGREKGRVHVIVGGHDPAVSRRHATIRCTVQGETTWWTLRNTGKLPIYLPQAPKLLQDQETLLPDGFTPLHVGADHRHAVEVLVSHGRKRPPHPIDGVTRDGRVPLSPAERLVLVAMFQDYLQGTDTARPRSRLDTSTQLNQVPGQSGWTIKRVEHRVADVRLKLGIDVDSAPPDQLRDKLINHLLNTGSLVPSDLDLLDGPRRH